MTCLVDSIYVFDIEYDKYWIRSLKHAQWKLYDDQVAWLEHTMHTITNISDFWRVKILPTKETHNNRFLRRCNKESIMFGNSTKSHTNAMSVVWLVVPCHERTEAAVVMIFRLDLITALRASWLTASARDSHCGCWDDVLWNWKLLSMGSKREASGKKYCTIYNLNMNHQTS